MNDVSRFRRLSMALVVLAFVAIACSAETPEAELVTANNSQLPDGVSHLSMAIDALENIDRPGTYVVPSDVSVLALDADALADLATGNGIRSIVDGGQLSSPIGPAGIEDSSVLQRERGEPFRVTSDDQGQLLVEGLPWREVVEWGDYQLVVVDGVLGMTKVEAE